MGLGGFLIRPFLRCAFFCTWTAPSCLSAVMSAVMSAVVSAKVEASGVGGLLPDEALATAGLGRLLHGDYGTDMEKKFDVQRSWQLPDWISDVQNQRGTF